MRIFIAAVLAAGLATAPLPALAQTAPRQPAAPDKQAAAPEKKPAKAKRPLSPGQIAMHERLKKCAAEWKEAKAAGKVEKGMKWPKYWSACNKRLKTAN
ncbi:MAG: hypothetical protein ACREB2_09340 [Pseudolabrys sp.]